MRRHCKNGLRKATHAQQNRAKACRAKLGTAFAQKGMAPLLPVVFAASQPIGEWRKNEAPNPHHEGVVQPSPILFALVPCRGPQGPDTAPAPQRQ